MNLNQGQKDAADAFFQFLLTDDKEFIISGPAGVGKTFLMGYLIDTTIPRYHQTCKILGMEPDYNEVVMTATTNKAAEVLGLTTKRPTQTIHSYFKLRVIENYDDGSTKLIKAVDFNVHSNKIIFIDECSMIDSALYQILTDSTFKCKLVYVGDHNQLAPVQENLSPVYKHNAPMYELTEPMRNNGQPALMSICQQLRDTVSTGEFNPIRLVPGVIDLLDDGQMQAEIGNQLLNQNPLSRILAYTNKRVMQFNDHVRGIRNLNEHYQAGEIVINNTAFQVNRKTRMLTVEEQIDIIKNHGSDKVEIEPGVFLDIDLVDIRTKFGELMHGIKVPTNKEHQNQLMKYYAKQKNWTKYYDLKNTYPDFRPRDAATVHKSQGSTYDNVFIDLGNISTCNIPDQVARMLYVAFSRARNRVFLYGELASRYGGILR